MTNLYERLRTGMLVLDRLGTELGTVAEVWDGAGAQEAWGAAGTTPVEGATAADPEKFAFSEAMPGEGESYFRLRRATDGPLYVPFGYIETVRGDAVILSVAADDIPAFQWDIRPDWLNNHQVADSGAPSSQA
jgi:hypothetical protein